MTSVLLRNGRIVTPTAVLHGGSVRVVDGRITEVAPAPAESSWAESSSAEPSGAAPSWAESNSVESSGAAPTAADPGVPVVDLRGGTVLPGLVELHVHGGGGGGFDNGTKAIATGLATHRANGSTAGLISLVTAPPDQMVASIAAAAEYAAGDPGVLGLHLEGPFLSPHRRGVHDPRALQNPDPVLLQRLLDAGRGAVRVITLAPELSGGLELVRRIVGAGVRVAVGHSDADYDVALQAFRAGADLVTHAFNGMRPLHHRDPSIIGAAMDAEVVFEAVNDGVHLHPATVRLLHDIAPGRVALITDAMEAAGAADGSYRLGAFEVQVRGGEARLADGTIAGSTLTMAVAVQRAVQQVGMSLLEAVNAGSLVPALYLGVDSDHGSIRPGRCADLVFTDATLQLRAVMRGGEWVDERRP